jgi:hypothetical protein
LQKKFVLHKILFYWTSWAFFSTLIPTAGYILIVTTNDLLIYGK